MRTIALFLVALAAIPCFSQVTSIPAARGGGGSSSGTGIQVGDGSGNFDERTLGPCLIDNGTWIGVDNSLCMLLAGAQTITGDKSVTGAWDASGASATKPSKSGTTPPGTCADGETFFDTDATAGAQWLTCKSNAWSSQQTSVSGTAGRIAVSGNVIDFDYPTVPEFEFGGNTPPTAAINTTYSSATVAQCVRRDYTRGHKMTSAIVNINTGASNSTDAFSINYYDSAFATVTNGTVTSASMNTSSSTKTLTFGAQLTFAPNSRYYLCSASENSTLAVQGISSTGNGLRMLEAVDTGTDDDGSFQITISWTSHVPNWPASLTAPDRTPNITGGNPNFLRIP